MSATEYQRKILADSVRNNALAAALKRTIQKGDVVLDLGSGSGFLAMLARKLGAKECILIERDEESLRLCQDLLKKNKVTNCTVIHAHSFDVKSLPKADLIVCETLGNFAYEENIIETMQDARRFLKKGGKMIPQNIEQYVAPVTADRFYKGLESWKGIGHGIDWSVGFERSVNNIYVRSFKKSDLYDVPQKWDTVMLGEKEQSVRKGTTEWNISKQQKINGFALWWDCTLAPGIQISTSPHEQATHWEQIYLPILSPLTAKPGEKVRLTITSDSRLSIKINVAWKLEHFDAKGKLLDTQSLDMRKGY